MFPGFDNTFLICIAGSRVLNHALGFLDMRMRSTKLSQELGYVSPRVTFAEVAMFCWGFGVATNA
jgi:hypothetical protein